MATLDDADVDDDEAEEDDEADADEEEEEDEEEEDGEADEEVLGETAASATPPARLASLAASNSRLRHRTQLSLFHAGKNPDQLPSSTLSFF